MPTDQAPLMTPRTTAFTFASFVVMLVLAALDQTILATALPAITQELGGASQLSWVFSSYLIASTVVIPLYGKLADVHGSKPVLLAAVALFLLGSLACGLSASMEQLIAARGLQGAGGGGLLTLAMLGVVDLYPPEQRGRYQGLLGASYGLSTMFGPLVGGYIVEHASWHWAFFLNVPFALLAFGVLVLCFRAPPARHPHPVDYLGAALLGGVLVSLLLATHRDSEAGMGALAGRMDAGKLWALAGAAVVLGLLFVVVQRRVQHPLLPLSMFASRAFSAATVVSAASGVVLFAGVVFLPIYLQSGLGHSPTASAWQLMPVSVGITLGAVLSGRRLRANGRVRGVAVAACLLSACSFAALAALFRWAPEQVAWMSVCLLPLGFGVGTLFPLVTVVSQFSVPPKMVGVGTSTPIMVRSLGGALGVAALGALLAECMARHLAQQPPVPGPHPLVPAFASGLLPLYAVAALVCVLAALGSAWLPKQLARPTAG